MPKDYGFVLDDCLLDANAIVQGNIRVLALETMLGAKDPIHLGDLDTRRDPSPAAHCPSLNLFRALAKDNGIDPETFINSLGWPSFSDCEQSAQQFNS